MTEAYIAGFTKVAEAHGVDPRALMKIAQQFATGGKREYVDSLGTHVINNNPYGVLDTYERYRAGDGAGAITSGVGALVAPETGLWDAKARALTPGGTNAVNAAASALSKDVTRDFGLLSPKLVNNLLRPAVDSSGRLNAFGTNAVGRISAMLKREKMRPTYTAQPLNAMTRTR